METVTATTQGMSPLLPPPSGNVPALADQLPSTALIDLSKFDKGQLQTISDVAAGIDLRDTNTVLTFGTGPQRKLNEILSGLMQGMSANDAGDAGQVVVEVAKAVHNLRPAKLRREAEGADFVSKACVALGRLPVIGPTISALRYYHLMRAPLLKRFEEIEKQSSVHVVKLKGENTRMDALVDATKAHLREIEVYIAAGEQGLLREKAAFRTAHATAVISNDPLDAASLRDWAEQINLFEARLMEMKAIFVDDLIRIPEIRTAQSAIRIEMANAMSAVMFSLARTKRIMIQLGSLNQIRKAHEHSAALRKMNRELAVTGAQILQETVLRSKASLGESEADAAALEEAADSLLGTLTKALDVDRQARESRVRAEEKLKTIRDKLVTGLHTIAGQVVESTSTI